MKRHLLLIFSFAHATSSNHSLIKIEDHPEFQKLLAQEPELNIISVSAPSIAESANGIRVSINVEVSDKKPSAGLLDDFVQNHSDRVNALVEKFLSHYEERINEALREPTEEEKAEMEKQKAEQAEQRAKRKKEFEEANKKFQDAAERYRKGEMTDEEKEETLKTYYMPGSKGFFASSLYPFLDWDAPIGGHEDDTVIEEKPKTPKSKSTKKTK